MLAVPPASALRDYAIIDEIDSAIAAPLLPSQPSRLDDEDDAAWAVRATAHAKAVAEAAEAWRAAYERACETGDYSPLHVAGQVPTVFHVRQIGATAWAAFKRVVRQLGQDEIALLAVRLAVTSIDNLPTAVALTRAPYPGEASFGDVLTAEYLDAVCAAAGRDPVIRTGLTILQRRGAPLGK